MVKYLKRKANFNMTPDDIKEYEKLQKLLKKFQKYELKLKNEDDSANIINSTNKLYSEQNNDKNNALILPEKIEEEKNEDEYEEVEEEVEEEVNEEGEAEGEEGGEEEAAE